MQTDSSMARLASLSDCIEAAATTLQSLVGGILRIDHLLDAGRRIVETDVSAPGKRRRVIDQQKHDHGLMSDLLRLYVATKCDKLRTVRSGMVDAIDEIFRHSVNVENHHAAEYHNTFMLHILCRPELGQFDHLDRFIDCFSSVAGDAALLIEACPSAERIDRGEVDEEDDFADVQEAVRTKNDDLAVIIKVIPIAWKLLLRDLDDGEQEASASEVDTSDGEEEDENGTGGEDGPSLKRKRTELTEPVN